MNLEEWKNALRMQEIASLNLLYADKEDKEHMRFMLATEMHDAITSATEQKGIGLLIETIEGFLTNQKLQLVVLGDGEPGLVRRLFHLQKKFLMF